MNEKIVQPLNTGVKLFILKAGEKFILENKYYRNHDESLFVRSRDSTGKLFIPNRSNGIPENT